MISIEKVVTTDGFHALEPVWNSLLEDSAGKSVALTWEWLTTWWEVFGEERNLNILVARDGDEVIGIAPLLRRTVRHYGLFEYKRLEFLGSGENEADEICSDYLDFILRRGKEDAASEAILEELARDGTWDEILLTDVAFESSSSRFCDECRSRAGITSAASGCQTSLFLKLPNDWETFLSARTVGLRKRIMRDRRAFAKGKGELLISDSIAGFDRYFGTLIDLHQSRWVGRGHPGVFASHKFTRFHRLLAAKLLPKGWIKLFVVAVQDQPVAALYTFTYGGKMYYYQSGFVPMPRVVNSPGLLAQSFAIEHAIEAGFEEFDLLRGEVGSYKMKWGAQPRELMNLRLSRTQPKEMLYRTASAIVGGARGFKRAMRSAASPSDK